MDVKEEMLLVLYHFFYNSILTKPLLKSSSRPMLWMAGRIDTLGSRPVRMVLE